MIPLQTLGELSIRRNSRYSHPSKAGKLLRSWSTWRSTPAPIPAATWLASFGQT